MCVEEEHELLLDELSLLRILSWLAEVESSLDHWRAWWRASSSSSSWGNASLTSSGSSLLLLLAAHHVRRLLLSSSGPSLSGASVGHSSTRAARHPVSHARLHALESIG